MAVIMASFVLMKRQPNPVLTGQEKLLTQFRAADATGNGDQPKWAKKKWMGGEETAPEGRAQHGARSEEHGVEKGLNDKEAERPKDQEVEGIRHTADGERQLSADGGTVRTLPIRTPKRIASWMPRRIRAAVVAQYAAEEAPEGTEGPKDGSEKPRQLAVPYQNYRRYRG
jgi:hypothetical protein